MLCQIYIRSERAARDIPPQLMSFHIDFILCFFFFSIFWHLFSFTSHFTLTIHTAWWKDFFYCECHLNSFFWACASNLKVITMFGRKFVRNDPVEVHQIYYTFTSHFSCILHPLFCPATQLMSFYPDGTDAAERLSHPVSATSPAAPPPPLSRLSHTLPRSVRARRSSVSGVVSTRNRSNTLPYKDRYSHLA